MKVQSTGSASSNSGGVAPLRRYGTCHGLWSYRVSLEVETLSLTNPFYNEDTGTHNDSDEFLNLIIRILKQSSFLQSSRH